MKKVFNLIYKKEEFPHKCKVCSLGNIENEYDICPYCGWEDESLQNNNPNYIDGPNKMSLNQYKKFWEENKNDILKNIKTNPFYAIELSKKYYEQNFKSKK